jgi:hypothetical protein
MMWFWKKNGTENIGQGNTCHELEEEYDKGGIDLA